MLSRHLVAHMHSILPIERPSLALFGIEPWRAAFEFASHHIAPAEAQAAAATVTR